MPGSDLVGLRHLAHLQRSLRRLGEPDCRDVNISWGIFVDTLTDWMSAFSCLLLLRAFLRWAP